MKRWLALPLFAALAWAAPITILYDEMAPALSQVKSLQISNPTQAFDVLAQAEDRFRDGASELPPALRDGVLDALAEAKQALYRKSQTDLEVRIILIKGILGKALYDGYFGSLSAQPQQTSAYLSRLIAASGLPTTLQSKASSLVISGNLEGLRTMLERTYAQRMLEALQKASSQTNPASAYQSMVQAYAAYLVIQDSPRTQGLGAKAFYNALEKLTKSNLSGFRRDTQALTAQAKAMLKQLNGVQAAAKPSKPTSSKTATVKPTPITKPTAKVTKPVEVPTNGVMEVKLANPNTKGVSEIKIVTEPISSAKPILSQTKLTSAGYDKLVSDLGSLLGSPQQAERVAKQISAAGINSVEEWKQTALTIQGSLLEAQVHAEMGSTDMMRETLAQVYQRYQQVFAPIVREINPELAKRTTRLLETARTAVGLRTSDFSVLSGELVENRMVIEGKPLSTFHSMAVGILQAIMGIPRAFVFILAGLLSIFPLYLLSLTFGGRNRYWQLLGVAFFFLLLPVMFEGLSYIGAVLSDSRYGKLTFLSSLNAFSIQQNIFAQLFWAVSVFLAIVFAAVGLRGIATQFGLLQTRRAPETLSATSTGTSTGTIMATSEVEVNKPVAALAQPAGAPTLTMETIVDWDEEF